MLKVSEIVGFSFCFLISSCNLFIDYFFLFSGSKLIDRRKQESKSREIYIYVALHDALIDSESGQDADFKWCLQ